MSEFDLTLTCDARSIKLAVENMRALPIEIAQKIEKSVLKKALEPVFNDAVRRVPVGETGNLAKGIRLRIKRVGQNFYGEVVSTAQHSHLVELGHKLMRGPKKGKQRFIKWVPGKPFLRPAFLAHEASILDIAEREILDAISKRAV